MPRVLWPIRDGRPCLEVLLTLAAGGQPLSRWLLADTGAGSLISPFQLILVEDDCLLCGGSPDGLITLGGAYFGSFPAYVIRVQLPALGFQDNLRVVGVPSIPSGFDGIAGFRFLNRFTYGNFGDPGHFGLES